MNILALSFLMFIPFFGANAQKLDEKPAHEKSCIYIMGFVPDPNKMKEFESMKEYLSSQPGYEFSTEKKVHYMKVKKTVKDRGNSNSTRKACEAEAIHHGRYSYLGNRVQEHYKHALIKRGGGTLISLSVLYEGQTVDLCAKDKELCSTKEPDSLQHAPPPPTKVEKSPAKH